MVMPEMTSSRTWGEFFDPHCGGGARWRPFRFRPPSWMTSFPVRGHPRWRPEAEGPPSCAAAAMGIEKLALYYLYVFISIIESILLSCLLYRHFAIGDHYAPKHNLFNIVMLNSLAIYSNLKLLINFLFCIIKTGN